jgi:hypothetical protein
MTVGIVLRRVFIDCSAVQGGFRRVSLKPNAFITLSIVAKLGLPSAACSAISIYGQRV